MPDSPDQLEFARAVLREEASALHTLADRLDDRFNAAVGLIAQCATSGGTVLVSGLGKSGLVGAKISATLASLGVPSHAVHPTEASHGDLGRFRTRDLVICLSKSGETDEVINLAAILRQDGLPIISITGGGDSPSSLERLATVPLTLGISHEAGDMPAPTSSTTATLALGDALALAAARILRFTDADFARRHPGGSLGGVLRPVMDVVRFRAGENLPLIPDALTVEQALVEARRQSVRRPGALLLIDSQSGALTGIFTDGDLRRLVLDAPDDLKKPIADCMTRSPRTLPDDAIVRDAITLFREQRQDEIPVVDRQGKPVGLLDVQDLIALRLVRD
ncbi:MAG TPA: KpsF/GutQ family sugar-phosphate isomerase [Phycisphaerales bacterium]|nr:KpsF/GutQ family sugar-phosphate isomerase [Phycisphaerales bacterium]